jgi:Flp pilus assembly protein TadB
MAKKKYKIKARQAQARGDVPKAPQPKKRKAAVDFPFVKKNYILFLIGLVVVVLGFITLAMGDITIAPILLVIGYCVIIPVAILYSNNHGKKAEEHPAQISGD